MSRPAESASRPVAGHRRSVVHVVPHPDGWAVKREGRRRTRVYPTKVRAVKRGTLMADRGAGRLVVHRRDGTIQESRRYR